MSPVQYLGGHESAVLLVLMILLVLVECTDFLDGYFARKRGLVSDFGKLFDPFADVMLHITAFFCFTYTGFMPHICFLIIFYREFGMIFLRMIILMRGTALAARPGGKLKTVLYVVACFWTLAYLVYVNSGLNLIGTLHLNIIGAVSRGLFYVCTLAALISFVDYLIHFAISFKKQ
jgi:CDP-diacylglycerol--glycerol-3-phosphate 3-phosphatidyltransferase